MQNFLEIRFPENISYDAIGGPEFATDTVRAQNGYEIRNKLWTNPLFQYDVSYGLKSPERMAKLRDFFLIVGGRAQGFRFRDWFDHQAKNQELIQIGATDPDGRGHFQLYKKYETAGNHYLRKINKVVKGGLSEEIAGKTIKNDIKIISDSTVVDSNEFSLDLDTGIVTFYNMGGIALSPNGKITASFQFDVPVRFVNDHLPIQITKNDGYICPKILLTEIRI